MDADPNLGHFQNRRGTKDDKNQPSSVEINILLFYSHWIWMQPATWWPCTVRLASQEQEAPKGCSLLCGSKWQRQNSPPHTWRGKILTNCIAGCWLFIKEVLQETIQLACLTDKHESNRCMKKKQTNSELHNQPTI